MAVTDEGYVVAVKASARRASAAAGEWVNSTGSTREFPGRKAADSWARSCSTDDAPPESQLEDEDAILHELDEGDAVRAVHDR